MMGTAVWLLWVFGSTRSPEAVVMLVAYLLLLALGCWLVGQFASPVRGTTSRALAWAGAGLLALLVIGVAAANCSVSWPAAGTCNGARLSSSTGGAAALPPLLRFTIPSIFDVHWQMNSSLYA